MTKYVEQLAKQDLRAAFLRYAADKGLDVSTSGPGRVWANIKTVLHFSAFAHAWEHGLTAVPDPHVFARMQVARRWYENEVMHFSDGQAPAWDDLSPERQAKVLDQYLEMQREFNELGNAIASGSAGPEA